MADDRRSSIQESDVPGGDESGGDRDGVSDATQSEKDARSSIAQDDVGGDRDPGDAEKFRGLIFVLASCRPDVMSPKDRKALVDEAVAKLKDDARLRRELAEWKGA
jgi:hypothetical protein